MKLTITQQKALLKTLPQSKKNAIRRHCQSCSMRGEGLMDILKSAKKHLGPLSSVIGPFSWKHYIRPWIKKKTGMGRGLKLVGQGKCCKH
jgi:hypothetical protein